MHLKRWITSLIALPLLFLLIQRGGIIFTLTTIAVSIIALREFFNIAYQGHTPAVPAIYHWFAYASATLILISAQYQNLIWILSILILNLISVAWLSIFCFKRISDAPLIAVKQFFGVAYIPLFLAFIILLRSGSHGTIWVLFLFWVIAWGDIGAYYVGSYLGRHKLCPAISPNKTIEGAVGGLAANLFFAWVFKLLFFPELHSLTCMVLPVLAGAAGQAGDLFESEFKRAAGVKDSGRLLPGHGGFLDRIDALLFASPVTFLLKEFILP